MQTFPHFQRGKDSSNLAYTFMGVTSSTHNTTHRAGGKRSTQMIETFCHDQTCSFGVGFLKHQTLKTLTVLCSNALFAAGMLAFPTVNS